LTYIVGKTFFLLIVTVIQMRIAQQMLTPLPVLKAHANEMLLATGTTTPRLFCMFKH